MMLASGENVKLQVLDTKSTWYADGLQFTCSKCGNCCSGPAGFVWITSEEIVGLAKYLGLTPEETVDRYCHKVGGQFSLREKPSTTGQHDCVFLREKPAAKSASVTHSTRVCSIYSVRPLQCRTWPFWSGNLESKKTWDAAAVRCHGMNRGRHFTAEEIESLEKAQEWPARPPSSAPI